MDIANWIFTIITGLLGFMGVNLHSRVAGLEKKTNQIELDAAKEYVRKADFMSVVQDFKELCNKIEAKVDKLLDKLDSKQDK